jgi:CBS domain-containing protein
MRVQDTMNKDVCFCSPETNAAAAAEIMWRRNCGALPVVDEGGRVVGIVTDRDLFIALGTSDLRPSELQVGDIMNRELALCNPSNDIRDALRTMGQRQLRRLPVVDETGALRGVVSLSDIALRTTDDLSMDLLNTERAIYDRRDRRKAAQREAFWSERGAA